MVEPISGDDAAADRARRARGLMRLCFFLSGFAALLYQTVWMRLALARFGVNTSVVATVLSVFMLGLALGSVAAARLADRLESRFGLSPLRLYGLAELTIGIGGLLVPSLLIAGRRLLLAVGPAGGAAYTAGSALAIVAILLPFCTAMGLTFPSSVAFLRRAGASGPGNEPFSSLYLANVAGALVGAIVTPVVLIETFGFVRTSLAAVAANGAIAAAALVAFRGAAPPPARLAPSRKAAADRASGTRRAALFITGFSTMGMEVVWTRMYPPHIGTFVYSFATILATYLLATTAGSLAYRRLGRRSASRQIGTWWPWLCATALLPLFSASMSFPPMHGAWRVVLGLTPFCALLGFVTPALVDQEAGDDPARVGSAYAVNLVGCLAGPLAAGFVLLPALGTRWAALALALPLFLFLLAPTIRRQSSLSGRLAAIGLAFAVWFSTTLFEERFPNEQIRHDHVATVVAAGTGMKKNLFVNGVGMTELTTITKMMAHFPAAHLALKPGQPFDALVICFGMGTSFRALASWGANVTAVELVPSVTEMFGYYFPDGPPLLREQPDRLHIVHDDGRRFLDRTRQRFDLITVDPPPPVEAAGSSLLYSEEFYASVKTKMKPGAILQIWLPGGDRETVGGVARSILDSFPYVRACAGIDGGGLHFLASMSPIPRLTPDELARRMPEAAKRDAAEWIDAPAAALFARMLGREYRPESLLMPGGRESTVAITDDRAVNEFYILRQIRRAAAVASSEGGTGTRGAGDRR